MQAKGTFEISMHPEPPFDVVDGVRLGRVRIDKRFAGALDATSQVHMLSAHTPVENSAGYVAIERVVGALDGKRGSFVLQHTGVMTRGERSLRVRVVPDSATGELQGLRGEMAIEIVDGRHYYVFDYELGAG